MPSLSKPVLLIYSILFCSIWSSNLLLAQSRTIKGSVSSNINSALGFGSVVIAGTTIGTTTDELGKFSLQIPNEHAAKSIVASYLGYSPDTIRLQTKQSTYNFKLKPTSALIGEVVISGTMKEVSRLESAVPVEVYSVKFFKANPTPTIFEALQNINGVRPQLNCNICSTGDIHINGLEGPYTMILIDGMPIVSGLATVYGLSGIPQSLIERVEIVKGPASTLYGSEAVGGLINIITKKTSSAPLFAADVFTTSWGEITSDVSTKLNVGKHAQSLIGVNYFNYSLPIDNNIDGFTDVTIQNRISVFNKWDFIRKNKKVISLAGRYVFENRWGGEMNWSKKFRGGDSVYGESIYTKRWEFFGTYQLPTTENIVFQFSANGHDQNSVYGTTTYIAEQYVGFGQLSWNKQIHRNDFMLGATFRYTYYDDNTPATSSFDTIHETQNMPSNAYLPGIFIQDEIILNSRNKLLLGMRYDFNSIHGTILTPRLNYKWKSKNTIVRLGCGNGYRVANVFTEDHAALTGSRQVEFLADLKPETSWNGNVNFIRNWAFSNGSSFNIDGTAFYTYFNNKIIPDYESDPNKIKYNNLNGFAVSKGISINLDLVLYNGLKFLIGSTLMDVYSEENGIRIQQLFTERITGVWNIGYTLRNLGLSIDYTGNLYGPMRLPLVGLNDPRSASSPYWSLQNIQFTQKLPNRFEVYGGIKNLLNWTPNKGNPFIIARSNDPFDKEVQFGSNGQALVTANNPYGLTFDPSYVYGPNQGIRGFLGFRYTIQ